MADGMVHFIRHGETDNPDRIIYGRLPGFGLTSAARSAAEEMAAAFADADVRCLMSSPLQRALETAEPLARLLDLHVVERRELIEPWSAFEGRTPREIRETVTWRSPRVWPYAYSQRLPSWGEPYVRVARRMVRLVREVAGEGEVVCVTHQTPIAMLRRRLAGEPLWLRPIEPECLPLSRLTVRCADGRISVVTDYRGSGPGSGPSRAS